MKIIVLFTCTASILLSGCASIISQNSKEVNFTSQPSGATVSIIDNKGREIFTGTTPTKTHLTTGKPYFRPMRYTAKISKAGYADKTIEIRPRLNGWYFGNIFFGGLVGIIIVDPLTGAVYTLAPKNVDVQMDPVTAGQDHLLKIISLNDVSTEDKKRLVELR